MKTPLRGRIMGSVYAIFLLRKLASATAVKAYILGVSLGTAAYAVSLGNIIGNMLEVGSTASLANFIVGAFLNTELSIQLLMLTAALSFVLILRDVRVLTRTEQALVTRRS